MKFRAMTENEFMGQVIELAQLHKWRVAHFRPSMNRRGKWQTAVQADGAGFPDLVLLRGDRVIWAEVKTETGKLRPEQEDWLRDLLNAKQEVYIWRPSEWPRIQQILR